MLSAVCRVYGFGVASYCFQYYFLPQVLLVRVHTIHDHRDRRGATIGPAHHRAVALVNRVRVGPTMREVILVFADVIILCIILCLKRLKRTRLH